jgi:hypothetical protein
LNKTFFQNLSYTEFFYLKNEDLKKWIWILSPNWSIYLFIYLLLEFKKIMAGS